MAKYVQSDQRSYCYGFAKFLLVFTNFAFVLVGSFTIYAGLCLNNSGWLDIFRDDYTWMRQATMMFIIAFGIVVVVIALAGCCGTLLGGRRIIYCYNIFVTLAIIIFACFIGGSFFMKNLADHWNSAQFPVNNNEIAIAENFDSVYCLSETAYYCNSVSIVDSLGLFFGPAIKSEYIKQYGISSATLEEECRNNDHPFHEKEKVCDWCTQANLYHNYEGVFGWINNKCPPGETIAHWCVEKITSNSSQHETIGVPYKACRSTFLDLWSKWSLYSGITSIVFAAYAMAILALSVHTSKNNQRNFHGNRNERAPLIGRH